MQIKLCPLQAAVSELFLQATNSGKITLADRYGLLAALVQSELSEEEKRSIDRLLYSVRTGKLKIVDEISAMIEMSNI